MLPRPFGLVLQDWAPFADTPNKLGRQQLKRIVAQPSVVFGDNRHMQFPFV